MAKNKFEQKTYTSSEAAGRMERGVKARERWRNHGWGSLPETPLNTKRHYTSDKVKTVVGSLIRSSNSGSTSRSDSVRNKKTVTAAENEGRKARDGPRKVGRYSTRKNNPTRNRSVNMNRLLGLSVLSKEVEVYSFKRGQGCYA